MLFKNILWDYLGRFSLLFTTLAVMGVLSRILTPAEYGAVGIVTAISGLASVFLEFGLTSAIIQQRETEEEQLSTIFYAVLGGSALIYGLIFWGAPLIAEFYAVPALTALLRVSGLSFIVNACNLVPNALIVKQMRFREQSLRNVAVTATVGAAAIGLAHMGWGMWALVLQALLSPLFLLLINLRLTRWLPSRSFRLASIEAMFHYSKFLFLSSVLDAVYTRLDALLIGKAMTMQSVGFFSRAKGMETMVQGVTTSSLNAVMFPFFSKMQDDEAQMAGVFHRFFGIICGVLFLFTGLAYLNAPWAFDLLFGSQWAISAHYYRIIALAAFAYPLSALMLSVISARGNSKDFFKAEVCKKLAYTPPFFFIFWSIEAYLYAWLVSVVVAFFVNLYFLQRSLPVRLWTYARTVAQYMLLLVCFLTGLRVAVAFGMDDRAVLPALLCSVAYCGYFAVGLRFLAPHIFELAKEKFDLVKNRLARTPTVQ
jgi:teichuronic acid exporter